MRSFSSFERGCICVLTSIMIFSTAAASIEVGNGFTLTQASGGPVPYPYQPINLLLYPSSPLDQVAVTDGSLNTWVTVHGLDDVHQSNGANADTGAFAVFQYSVPQNLKFLHFSITAAVDYDVPEHETFFVNVYKPSAGNFFEVIYDYPATEPTSMSLDFTPTGNTGNFPPFSNIAIQDIVSANGTVIFGVHGGFIAQNDYPGAITARIYEVGIVPEPACAGILLLLSGMIVTSKRRGNTRRIVQMS